MFKESSQVLHPKDSVLSKAQIYPYFLEDGDNFSCFLVLPGGGYGFVSHQEGPPVAGWLNSMGISALVLEYSVGSKIYPHPQQQACYAMRWLRKNAAQHNINPNKIGVIGFSAGGHLAACLANGYDKKNWLLDPDNNLESLSARPDACLLSYPVISSSECGHHGSFINLFGEDQKDKWSQLSMEKHVHSQCPPTFIWHTATDKIVPAENAYLMATALHHQNIEHEVHIYPDGDHGLGLGMIGHRRQGRCEQWRTQAEHWMMDLGF